MRVVPRTGLVLLAATAVAVAVLAAGGARAQEHPEQATGTAAAATETATPAPAATNATSGTAGTAPGTEAAPAADPAGATPTAHGAAGTDTAASATASPAADAPLVPAQGVVDVQVDVQPTRVVVGQPVTLTFTLAYPEGTRAYFPENPAVSPFVPAGQRRTSQGVLGQGTSETHVLDLLPVRPGKAVVGPLEIAYVGPDGEAGIARTPRIELDVGTTLGDEAAPELASPGTPVPVRVRNDPLIWTLAALGVAIVAAGLGILGYRRWRRWRDARRPAPPPIPAHERALAALADLELLGLGRDGDWRELALRVSEVVREFLGARLGFNGVEATSWEVVRAIRGRDLGRMTPERIEDLLSLCDLIKFAKFQPSDAEGQALVPRAREVVLGVMAGTEGKAGTNTGTVTDTDARAQAGAGTDTGSDKAGGGDAL